MRSLRTIAAAAALLALATAAIGCKGKSGPPVIKDTVEIVVDSSGFNPPVVYARRGKPITIVFTRTEEHTCATEVVIESEKIRKDLPMNAAIPLTFIPSKAGDIPFACAMNMVKGKITVVN